MNESPKKVFIALPCGELARYSSFWQTRLDLDLEGVQVLSGQSQGLYIDFNQNGLVRKMLEAEKTFGRIDYVWLLNDDMIMPRSTLKSLIDADKDVTCPIMVQHDIPFDTLFFDYRTADGLYHHKYLEKGDRGLIRGLAAGGGGMLIKRDVFASFPDPWWETHWAYPNPGEDGFPTRSTEDFDFCKKVEDAGFEVWCNLDCPVGHQTIVTLWPVRQPDGTWMTSIERRGRHILIPAALDPVKHATDLPQEVLI